MKKLRFSELQDVSEGHIFQTVLPGKHLYHGGIAFSEPGDRSHTNDGPDGKDFHVHEDCEAFLILQGKGMLEINKKESPITTGDLIIVEPGEDHHLIADQQEPLVTLWCHAGPERHGSLID